jgi:RNA polymerase sigma-70 factor (ECF subfamily)
LGSSAHRPQRDPLSEQPGSVLGLARSLPPTRVDPAVVAAARGGDRRAFDALVRATYRQVYTLALRLTPDPEDARDVTQEVYLRAYRSLGRFRGDAQFETWLHRIAVNCALSARTRAARHRHEALDLQPDTATPAEPTADRHALRKVLETAIAELPPRLRAVLVLRDIYDLPHDAIAAELGISTNAAKIRLHRARRLLRVRLDELLASESRHVG